MKNHLTQGEQFMRRHDVEFIPRGVRVDYTIDKDTKKWLLVFGILALFIIVAILLSLPTESYASSVYISNTEWCSQALRDHAVSGESISSEIVKMCAKHLGV